MNKTMIICGMTILAATAIFSIGNALGQFRGRSSIERLTGKPAAAVVPSPHAVEAAYGVPPGWTLGLMTPVPSTRQKVVLLYELGGRVDEHWYRFQAMAERHDEVEVRGPCYSACTMVVAAVARADICFSEKGLLGFHLTRNETAEGDRPNYPVSRDLYGRFPRDIRAWLDAKGGVDAMPMEGYWSLPATELWKMGYRKCDD